MHPLHGTLDNTKGKWIQKISGLLDSADNARFVSFRAKDFENAFCNEINGIFFFSMSAAMLCDNRDCYAQAAGDATVVYGDRVGNVVTANCDYWSNSGDYRAQAVLYTAISVKGKYRKDKQVGRAARLSPTFNDLKNLYDYNGSVAAG